MHAKHEENWCPGRHSHAAAAEIKCSCRVSMKVQAKIRPLSTLESGIDVAP